MLRASSGYTDFSPSYNLRCSIHHKHAAALYVLGSGGNHPWHGISCSDSRLHSDRCNSRIFILLQNIDPLPKIVSIQPLTEPAQNLVFRGGVLLQSIRHKTGVRNRHLLAKFRRVFIIFTVADHMPQSGNASLYLEFYTQCLSRRKQEVRATGSVPAWSACQASLLLIFWSTEEPRWEHYWPPQSRRDSRYFWLPV